MPLHYPFSAVVGCESDDLDDMGLALVLTTISPEIGGVLIRGEKGTAKSTTVRALAAVLPPIEVYDGDRFSVDPAGSDTSPDGPVEGTAVVERDEVRRETAGEDRDDRERDREVREPAHLAIEHLGVAELV